MGRQAVARLTAAPSAWQPLPDAMAAALGRTIAAFGHLEDMLKRAVFALERDGLPGEITERDFAAWLRRMEHVETDSLGNLIERLDQTLRRANHMDAALDAELGEIKTWRNVLCHAAWHPTPAGWVPAFSGSRGEVVDSALSAADLTALCDRTLAAAQRVGRVIEAALVADWKGSD